MLSKSIFPLFLFIAFASSGMAQNYPPEPVGGLMKSRGLSKIKPFEKGGKYGFRSGDSIVVEPQYDDAKSFIGGIAVVQKGDRYGMIDETGQIIIPFDYEGLGGNLNGIIPAKKEGKWGYINPGNKTIHPFTYDKVEHFGITPIAPAKYKGKWGFLNRRWEWAIQPIYEEQKFFIHGPIKVKKDGFWGLINASGDDIIPVVYDTISGIDKYIVTKNNKIGAFRKDGSELLKVEYDYAKEVGKGTFILCKNGKCALSDLPNVKHANFQYDVIELPRNRMFRVQKDGKYGWLNSHGSEIIPTIYEETSEMKSWGVEVKKDGTWGKINQRGSVIEPFGEKTPQFKVARISTSDGKVGVFSHKEMIIPYEYDEIVKLSEVQFLAKKDSLWGILDNQNNILIPFIYQEIKRRFQDKIIRVKREGLYGYMNEFLEPMVEPKFEKGGYFDSRGNAVVGLNGLLGLINNKGQIIVPLEHEKMSQNGDIYFAEKEGLKGYFDRNGKNIIPLENEKLRAVSASTQYIWAEKNGLQGFYDRKGKVVIPFEYEVARSLGGFMPFLIKKEGKYGYLNNKGEPMIPTIYDSTSISGFVLSYAAVLKGDYWGYVHKDGVQIIEPKYIEATHFFYPHFARVKTAEGWGLIDGTGKEVIKPQYKSLLKNGKWLEARTKKSVGIVDFENVATVPIEYDSLYFWKEEHIGAKKRKRWGVINIKNEMVLPFEYELAPWYAQHFDFYKVKKKGKYGAVNKANEVIIPFEFDYIRLDEDRNLLPVRKKDKWGYINPNGEIVIPIKYDKVGVFGAGVAEATLNGVKGWLDKAGKFTTF